jgi:hypothetical protein
MKKILGLAIVLAVLLVSFYIFLGEKKNLPWISNPSPSQSAKLTATPAPMGQPQQDGWRDIDNVRVSTNYDGPKGEKNAEKISEDSSMGLHRVERIEGGLSAEMNYTLSAYVKPAERKAVRVEIRDNPQKKYGIARFNLETGKVIDFSGDISDAGIEATRNGWYRVWVSMPFSENQAVFNFQLMDTNLAHQYQGDGSSALFLADVRLQAKEKEK